VFQHAGNFPSGTVNVPETFVEPDAAGKKRIAADQVFKDRAFKSSWRVLAGVRQVQ